MVDLQYVMENMYHIVFFSILFIILVFDIIYGEKFFEKIPKLLTVPLSLFFLVTGVIVDDPFLFGLFFLTLIVVVIPYRPVVFGD
ncbi:hypothetical protein [Texcoconibacillus texcoconensis]|uniref:Uncharacterized protein n=1 Tax=Texcoconibacillus texcoconensis TaxID=1095777 RepID=A0A840QUW5_9BACI|nr:hypothetical protein [Texcoconibacillus texcoconensis]MBB5175093.1 hypothetical protein [Texcoconibacillus texcoconensis]